MAGKIDPRSAVSPAEQKIAITPGDAAFLIAAKEIYVGTGGNVAVQDLTGNTVIYKNVPNGGRIPGYVARVLNAGAGTTASDLIGEF